MAPFRAAIFPFTSLSGPRCPHSAGCSTLQQPPPLHRPSSTLQKARLTLLNGKQTAQRGPQIQHRKAGRRRQKLQRCNAFDFGDEDEALVGEDDEDDAVMAEDEEERAEDEEPGKNAAVCVHTERWAAPFFTVAVMHAATP